MINYGDLDNVSGVHPDAAPVDVSAPAAGDGTKVEAAWVQQTWGFFQAIMEDVEFTPDDVDEVQDASQLMEALKEHLAPVSQIIAWHGADDPDTFSEPNVRLLPCEGQVVLIADYPELTDRCYVGDGNCLDTNFNYWYKVTDGGGGTRSTAGTYIKVADLRGVFLRGRDTTAIHDPSGATRELPQLQGDALQEHEHEVQALDTDWYIVDGSLDEGTGTPHTYALSTAGQSAGRWVAGTITSATTNADETRPVNVNVVWCIRY